MKSKITIVTGLLFISSFTFAQEQTEEQCAKHIEASVAAIELMSQQTGTEQKLKDLSVSDIRNMQKTKGNCETMQEINKRTTEKQKRKEPVVAIVWYM